MKIILAIQLSISFLQGGEQREDVEEKQCKWGERRSQEPLLHSTCSHRSVHVRGSVQQSAVPALEETTTIITVMNVLGPFAVILPRVINTVNN